jgi:hypothetical protein
MSILTSVYIELMIEWRSHTMEPEALVKLEEEQAPTRNCR